MKKCKGCSQPFVQVRPMQNVCGMACALAVIKLSQSKEFKKETRKKKKEAREKDAGYWKKRVTLHFNKYIRERDKDLPCISCGTTKAFSWHAGHYRSVGACPSLRFEALNCHKQCSKCNTHLSGNLWEYRIELINRIGEDAVEWIRHSHPEKRYRVEELKALCVELKQKVINLGV